MSDAIVRLVRFFLRLLGFIPSLKEEQVLFVARSLSVLQNAGAPVLRSLRIVASDLKPGKVKSAMLAVVNDVESGDSLSEALGKHPEVFNKVFTGMVQAGEAGGALEVILPRIAAALENPKAGELARTLRALGFMTSSGVPILAALSIVKGMCRTEKYTNLWQDVFNSIREGDTIAEPLRKCGFVPNTVIALIDIGEETGDLDTTLINAADWCEENGLTK
jgi:type II secretory pathway component PulF